MNHISSETRERKTIPDYSKKIFELLFGLCTNANKLLIADGDFQNRSYSFVKSICDINNKSIIVIENTYNTNNKIISFTKNQEEFYNLIKEDLHNNLKLVVPTMGQEMGEEFVNFISTNFPNKHIKFYHSKISGGVKQELNKGTNFAFNCDVLIYTSCIEAGLSCELPFDKMYVMCCCNTVSSRALSQMMNRVRYIKDNNILMYLNNSPIVNNSSDFNLYKFDDILPYYTELSKTIYFDNGVTKYADKILTQFDINTIHNKVEELNKSLFFFFPSLIQLLKSKNFTINDNFSKKVVKVKSENIINKKISNSSDIADVSTLEILKSKKNNNTSTELENYQLEKHFLKDFYDVKFIDNYFVNTYDKLKTNFTNLTYLLDDSNIDNFTKNKVNLVKNLIVDLGWNNCFDSKILDKPTLTSNIANSIKSNKIFTDFYSIKHYFTYLKHIKTDTIKNTLSSISPVLKEFCISIKSKRSQSYNKGLRTENRFYSLSFINDIHIFLKNKILSSQIKDINHIFIPPICDATLLKYL